MQSLRDQIIVLSLSPTPDWNNVRKLIGEYLFTVQMFYSNTNWVETFGNATCQELGQVIFNVSRTKKIILIRKNNLASDKALYLTRL